MDENLIEKVACGCEIIPEDWDLIICRCEEVTRGDILTAINEGDQTVEEIKRRTRTGMGLCQSKTCCRNVQKIISEATGKPISNIPPFTSRPPVRPISIGVLASLVEEDTK
ncbi:MAG: (2Fe-2S)-binding protein [Anaerolineaceae bacterium]|nr:(2Fe-2S)-binding protein [Anaerolineaceae bacterium]